MDPICTEKRSLWATPKMVKIFFGGNKKADHQLSESFYFIKIYVLIELWIFFYSILSDVFCQKSVISSITAVPPIQNALKNKAGGHNYLRTPWLEFLSVFTLSLEFPGNIKLHSWSLLLSNGNGPWKFCLIFLITPGGNSTLFLLAL